MRYIQVLMLSVLISLSCSYIVMSLSVMASGSTMSGRDLVEEVLIALYLGLTIGCTSFIFFIERFGFGLQLLAHFIGIGILVYIAGYIGNWYDVRELSTVLTVFGVMSLVYGISWVIVKSILKSDVQRMNQAIKKKREGL